MQIIELKTKNTPTKSLVKDTLPCYNCKGKGYIRKEEEKISPVGKKYMDYKIAECPNCHWRGKISKVVDSKSKAANDLTEGTGPAIVETPSRPLILDADNYQQHADYIEQNCSEVLEVYRKTNQMLFNGNKHHYEAAFVGTSPRDRSPVDTPMEVQKKFDNLLAKAGFSALRSNSIFCNSSRYSVKEYGMVYRIFPVNGFRYTWSSTICDLWIDKLSGGNREEAKKEFMDDLEHMSPTQFVRTYEMQQDELLYALKSTHEVLIHGNYIALNDLDMTTDYICRLLGVRRRE